jgi:hypothetical protein
LGVAYESADDAMESSPLDGSLARWQDVAEEFRWDTLLIGNGLSINIWPHFEYRALFDHAGTGGLSRSDLALFDNTLNFERVLADLNTTIRVMSVCGCETSAIEERYRRVSWALGGAIRAVHLKRTEVANTTLAGIREHLLKYQRIFTTSYDLLLYWAMGAGPKGEFAPFTDLFWNRRCQFDLARANPLESQIPVYFLHGALHLVVGDRGDTWKLKRNMMDTLLDQFGQPIPSDPLARPLLVTEGSARDKIQAIDRNDYLSHAIEQLRRCDSPIVVFGSSLSPADGHLVDALNEHRDRPVAVSLYPGAKRHLAAQQSDIYARLEAEPLLFFNSTTQPLGSPSFRSVW